MEIKVKYNIDFKNLVKKIIELALIDAQIIK